MRLAEVQHAFFAAVRARGAAPTHLDELFTASARQTATERLAVYHHAYWQRQLLVLANTFPRLQGLLDQRFEPLMLRYLERCPSGAPCIELIGNELAAFLDEQAGVATIDRDVARLEWASLLALLAPDCRDAELPRYIGPTIVDCRLEFAPCLQIECVTQRALAVFRAPPDEAQRAFEASALDANASEPVWVALSRRRFAVTHVQIAADEARALELGRRGEAFSSICEAFAALPLGEAAARAAAVLSSWFGRGWVTHVSPEGSQHASP